ncbi:hypothetical protein VPNG_09116 [Cytospora leucostoma]|uniref:Peroxidase n=1 Tax=Cytospora leucostoma TaxID=1230097 RepID=A0A423VP78_9PEZI|nr:hypothetical protein VPNG_09116 [Cytospora leucostoma]
MFGKANLVAFLLATGAAASSVEKRQACPDVWREIARELRFFFADEEGYCTDDARAAIRLPFQDCFPDGGCDGSIILSEECYNRRDNAQLVGICASLSQYYKRFGVGAADLINFAAAIATKVCPGGPYIPFYIGRPDNAFEATRGQIPPPTLNSTDMIEIFAERGFSPDELVALVGAHSVGKTLRSVPLDSTPEMLDSRIFYSQTQYGDAPETLPSDRSLALDPVTIDTWVLFSRDQEAWERAYIPAIEKMILQGNDPALLTDCSILIRDAFEL